MVQSLNKILALVATGHAYDKHVLGKDGGDREFSDRRFGKQLTVRSCADVAKMLQDIIKDKNTHVAYASDTNAVFFANEQKNVSFVLDCHTKGGDCGTFMRPWNREHCGVVAYNNFLTRIENSRNGSFQIFTDPNACEQVVRSFLENIKPTRQMIERLNEREVQKVIEELNNREMHQEAASTAKIDSRQEDKLAQEFIRFAKKQDNKGEFEITIGDDGKATVIYPKKNDFVEATLGRKNTQRVKQALAISA